MNYFELYNIPISFSPSKTIVKKQYIALSKKYHPDFVATATEFEQQDALEISSNVNKAYKIFNNQDENIKYVLQLKELLVDDEKYDLPKDFLMDVMDINEALMEAKMDEDEESLAKINQSISNIQHSIFDNVKQVIEAESIDNIATEELFKVKDYYFKKKYLNRILDSLK